MSNVYTNDAIDSQYIKGTLDKRIAECSQLFLAVAFFTDSSVILKALQSATEVNMLVRLGFPTSPESLEDIFEKPGLKLRYFNSTRFHPKLYLFDNSSALVGSANLTSSALSVNQEVVVSIEDEIVVTDLSAAFSRWWSQARPLTRETLNRYAKHIQLHKDEYYSSQRENERWLVEIEKVEYQGAHHTGKKENKQSLFVLKLAQRYQDCVSAFQKVRSVFESDGRRRVDMTSVPLRVEVDCMISYIRDTDAKGAKWKSPVSKDKFSDYMESVIDRWVDASDDYYANHVVVKNYPLIMNAFKDKETS